MKNQYIRTIVFISMFQLIFVTSLFSQATVESNIPGFGAYLGWNDTGNANLNILQNNTLRKRFTSVNFAGHNGANAVNNASRMFLGLNGGFQNPFSMIHMGSNITNLLYRPWMNVGITMGASQDILHLGILQRAMPGSHANQIDAVLAWGCNDDIYAPFAGPDNFRFLFIAPTNGTGDGAAAQGRETMRITPMGNVGIGDFSHMPNGLNEQPTQRLDVDGTARLRQMPSNMPNALITGVEANGVGDYVLNHLEFNNNPNSFLAGNGTWQAGTNVCDWTITGQNLTAGHPTACHTGNVGIGRAAPARKLDVLNGTEPTIIGGNSEVASGRFVNNNTFTRTAGVMGVASQETPSTAVGANTGGYFVGANAGGATGSNYGVVAVANDLLPQGGEWVPSARESMAVRAYSASGTDVFGVYATATQGSWRNFGVSGFCYRPISGSFSIGVAGRSDCDQNHVPLMNIGVYGEVRNGCGLPQNQNYAGYFAGNVMIGGNIINFSDASLKTDVQEIEGALNTINQLQPKTYNYLSEENQTLGLPEGQQYGLIAQEVEEVLPNLTQLVRTLPDVDSLGNVLTESNEFLAINYTGLIPVLISGMKEQQTIIENQNDALAQMMDQLAAMQQQINECCNSGDGNRSMPGGIIQPQDFNNQKSVEGGNELFQNIPNPFRESTTISYQLEEGGRVQLSIYDNNGKVITTLTDANQGPGRYSEVWNANGMPSGVYHYALYVNGELLVKRAIKLQE